MRKLFFAAAIIGLATVTSCEKKEKTTDSASTEQKAEETASAETTAAAESTSDVPKFSNADVQKFADEYAAYYKEVIAAAKAGDQAKMQELATKASEWGTKSAEWATKMTPEDAKLFAEWNQKLVAESMPAMPTK